MSDELDAAMAAGNGATPDLVASRPAAITFIEDGGDREVTYVRRDLFDQLMRSLHMVISDLYAFTPDGMLPPATSDALRQIERYTAEINRSAQ